MNVRFGQAAFYSPIKKDAGRHCRVALILEKILPETPAALEAKAMREIGIIS
jgi:hypothetical protein